MEQLERRYTPGHVELRAAGDKRMIGGYAAVFDRLSRNLGGFVEKVAPVAFNRSRGNNWPDVIARFEHENSGLLGTTAARTLSLAIDDTGLLYEVDPPRSRADVVELVERGDVRHSSFAFRTIEDDWGKSDQGFPLRTLLSVSLVDVAPVVSPAYPDATAGLRSLARHLEIDYEEVAKRAADDELRSFFTTTKTRTLGAAARMAVLERKTDPWVTDAPGR